MRQPKFAPLPCPFCGMAPTVQKWHGGGPLKTAVICEDEDCCVNPMVTAPTRYRAIERWNTRP